MAKNTCTGRLSLIKQIGEKFDDCHIINILMGKDDAQVKNYEHDKLEYFGSGKEQGENLWNSLMRQALAKQLPVKRY
jgi:ATP-dependent DNA helicase RecQ